jgi:hypothetical protein
MRAATAPGHGLQGTDDFQSLDQQIKDARRRAEEFSQKIQKTREEEEETIKYANEERKKWAVSYEEKTVMIEQLQRELASTVEALNVERKADRYHAPLPLPHQPPPSRGPHHQLSTQDRPTNNHLNYRSNTHHHHTTHSSSDWIPPPPLPMNNNTTHHLSAPPSSALSATIESDLRHEITKLKSENEQTKRAWKDSEAKIHFYLSQIKQLEIEINLQSEEKKSNAERLRSLEKINQKLKTELEVVKTFEETKRSEHDAVMELQETMSSLLLERERFEKTVVSRDEEIRLLRAQLGRNEKERKDWEESLKELHHKEIELLHRHYQLLAQEQQQQQQQQQQIESSSLSPVNSSHHEESRRGTSPETWRGSRVANQTKVGRSQSHSLLLELI